MNRITNKNKKKATGEWCKHPRPFLKRLGNARLRSEPIDDQPPKHIKKKGFRKFKVANRCPFCLAHIPKQWTNSTFRHLGSCKECGATKQGKISCLKCSSENIWLKESTYMCKNCGKNWEK